MLSKEEIEASFAQGLEWYKLNPPMRRGKKIPYVLFGALQKDYSKENKERDVANVVMLPMDTSHCQTSVIDYYVLKKNFTILDWWFPRLDESTKRRFYDGGDPYEPMQAHLYKLKNLSPAVAAAQRDKIDAMEKKIKELEAKASKK